MLCFENIVLCFENIVLCFDNSVLCFDNVVLCFNNTMLCVDYSLLCFDNTVLCLEKCLLFADMGHRRKKIQCKIQIQRVQISEARDLNYTFFRILHSKKTWQVISNATFCMNF